MVLMVVEIAYKTCTGTFLLTTLVRVGLVMKLVYYKHVNK